METPRVYMACLASYNAGILYGRWINANQGIDELQDQINAMLAESTFSNAEEWALHAHDGFGNIQFEESEDLETIVNSAEFIIKHGELGLAILEEHCLDDAQIMIEDHYHGCYNSEVDFARYVLEEYYDNPISDKWIGYFDYEAFADDLFICDFNSIVVRHGEVHVFSQY